MTAKAQENGLIACHHMLLDKIKNSYKYGILRPFDGKTVEQENGSQLYKNPSDMPRVTVTV